MPSISSWVVFRINVYPQVVVGGVWSVLIVRLSTNTSEVFSMCVGRLTNHSGMEFISNPRQWITGQSKLARHGRPALPTGQLYLHILSCCLCTEPVCGKWCWSVMMLRLATNVFLLGLKGSLVMETRLASLWCLSHFEFSFYVPFYTSSLLHVE